MTPEERRHLYETASTPEDARALLIARGMPRLGNLVCPYRQCVRGHEESVAIHFEKIATIIESGRMESHVYFERPENITTGDHKQVAAALRWCATVWRRWGQRPREASEVEQIDEELRRRGRGRKT